ncbi:MAG: hypothetical protein MK200_05230 [Nitrosopumilus sp.]|nr:hypothetical protein [Nitrosopumilus sp.]
MLYCSKHCQKKHFPKHRKYCSVITDLENLEVQKLYKNHSVREEQVDTKTRSKLIRLIGDKPLMFCTLDGVEFEVLWDTGSMISLVDLNWVKKYFPEKKLYPVEDFLQNEILQIRAANSTEISFMGILLFDFTLKADSQTVTIPFLVTPQHISEPILGYNVIEHLVSQKSGGGEHLLNSSFVAAVGCDKIKQLVAVIQDKLKMSDVLDTVKVPETTVISAGSCSLIKCKVKLLMDVPEKTVHFLPQFSENGDDDLSFSETISTIKRGRTQNICVDVRNPTNSDLILKKGVVIGKVCGVSAVIPMKIEHFLPKVKSEVISDDLSRGVKIVQNAEVKWMPKVDLSHLTTEQKGLVEGLLLQECDVFSTNDSDIGDIQDFQMKISLSDEKHQ